MKKIYIALGISMALCHTSCSDFFDQVPTDRLTYADLFETKASTEKALATVYTYIPDEFNQRFVASGNGQATSGAWTAGSDEAEYCWGFVGTQAINNNTLTPTTGMVNDFWKKYYRGISAAGQFIKGAPMCKELDPTLTEQWVTEARAVRAIYYFYLLRIFGPIPLLGEEPVPVDAPVEAVQLPRNTVEQCVEYIVSEFDKVLASGKLADKVKGYDYGRVDNGIVMAFKAEVLQYAASNLYNGSNPFFANLQNPDGTKLFPQDASEATIKAKWRKAADASKAFIDKFVPTTYDLHKLYTNGVFDAYKSYREVVRGDNMDGNKEMIFYRIGNSASTMQYDRTPYHYGAPSGDYRASGALGASQQMVDAYFMANGKSPVSGYNGGQPVINQESGYQDAGFTEEAYMDPATGEMMAPKGVLKAWVNREPRFYADITFSGQKWLNTREGDFYTNFEFDGNSGKNVGKNDYCPTGFSVRKSAPLGPWGNGGRVCILLRLAQVYLNYAEALNECEPSNSDIVKYLNLIRERAGIPTYGSGAGQIPVPAGQEAMREAIRKERRVELAFENSRYFDVRRWGIAEQTENTPLYGMNVNANGNDYYKRTLIENRIFEKKLYFFPIPQDDINIDKQLVQNPGWNAD